MKGNLNIVTVSVIACLLSTGCVKDINSPSSIPQEPNTVEQQPQANDQANDEEIALPAPEMVEAGQDGQLVPNQPVQPVVTPKPVVQQPPVPIDSNLKQPEYAPLAADQWDIKLPEPELKPGDPALERTPEVEQTLSQALNNIAVGNLSFLRRNTKEYDSYPVGGINSIQSAGSKPTLLFEAESAAPRPKGSAKKAKAPKSAEHFSIGGAKGGGVFDASHRNDDFPPVEMNTDEFSQYDPNRFINAAANPLSTFGADVDTASYAVFRRSINEGRVPRNQDLRVEEMINYFKYDYPNPRAGEPFSVTTEIAGCPWNKDTKLMLVGAKTRELSQEERPASNIVFLLDISGSMRGDDRLALIKASLLSMLPKLTAQDKISIVTYSGAERFIIDGVAGDHHATIMKALTLFDASGVTNGEAGIKMAYAVAKKNYIKGGNNRIIMGTDGDLNVGISNTNELKALIEKKRESGIFLSVLGVGRGNYKDNRLETLADYGNGSYHYIDTLREGRRVLVDEFMSTVFVAAKDVKFQVDFNPGKIKGYRQIGYETRKLNAEDFADDKKDGGEVGAGHQVTILYEIVEQGSAVDVPEPSSKYQKVEAVKSDEYATVKLRYKKPDGDVSTELSWPISNSSVRTTMSENMNFASAVAATAMILNNSAFKGTATYDSILDQLKNISSLDKDEYRAEFVALVRRLKGL